MVTEELLNIKRGGIRLSPDMTVVPEIKVPPYHYWMLLLSKNVHLYLWKLQHWELLAEMVL